MKGVLVTVFCKLRPTTTFNAARKEILPIYGCLIRKIFTYLVRLPAFYQFYCIILY